MVEKRRYHRMKIVVPMSFRLPPENKTLVTSTLDISGLGVSFVTDKALKVRQELLMYLSLPGEEKVETHARIVRVEDLDPGFYKVSVELVDPIKFDEKKFVKFYATKLKEFFKKK